MIELRITCPVCSKKSSINVSENMKNDRGITAINISNKQVCPHSFIIYTDNNLTIRDSFVIDFQIELPHLKLDLKIKQKDLSNSDFIDVFLIKMLLLPSVLTSILRGIVFKQKILILINKEFSKNQIFNFFNFIFENSFETNISCEESEYGKNQKEIFKNHQIILEKNEIFKDKEKILNQKKMKTERQIVQKFFGEYDAKLSLILLRNEIQKAYVLSNTVLDFIKNQNQKKIEITRIIDEIESVHFIRVSSMYLDFIIEIVENYFEIKVPIISKNVIEFL